MTTVAKSIEIDLPRRAVYDQWTQFETFPRFMEGVEDVRQIDDTHLHWVAEVAGKTKEWDAEITEQEPDRRIAWKSLSGARNDGVVTFEEVEPNRTRVSLQLDATPEGPLEQIGTAAGLLERRVEGDLERFRDFIKERGAPSGAWRGKVEAGSRSD